VLSPWMASARRAAPTATATATAAAATATAATATATAGAGPPAAGPHSGAAAALDGLPALDPRALDPLTPVIVGFARTPMGSFLGGLSSLTAPELAGLAIRAALARANGGGGARPPPSGDAAADDADADADAGADDEALPLLPLRLAPADVDEVLMGCVCTADLGQAPASQAARLGGLPDSVPATLINKACASGLKAVALAAQAIRAGAASCVVAGGMEAMSRVPHYLPNLRSGAARLGRAPDGGSRLVDGLLRDGLWCAEGNRHMGDCAEAAAEAFGISRAEQDDAAVATFARARAAEASGAAAREIAPVEVPLEGDIGAGAASATAEGAASAGCAAGKRSANGGGGGGGSGGAVAVALVDRDEPLARFDERKLRALRPCFRRLDGSGGTVTAGNASPLTDGAAAVVLVSARLAAERGLAVLAAVRASADANGPAEAFPTAPSKAAPLALARAGGLTPADVDFWEVNEAFMVVELVNRRLLGLEGGGAGQGAAEGGGGRAAGGGAGSGGGAGEAGADAAAQAPPSPPAFSRVNAHGGAVAIGHAIGASGAVLVGRLVNVLRTEGGRIGCAVICNGGGGASAIVLEAGRP